MLNKVGEIKTINISKTFKKASINSIYIQYICLYTVHMNIHERFKHFLLYLFLILFLHSFSAPVYWFLLYEQLNVLTMESQTNFPVGTIDCTVSYQYRIVLYRSVPYHVVSSHVVLFCIILYCIMSYILYNIVLHPMVSYHMVAYQIVWYHYERYHIVSYRNISYHISHRIVSYCIISYIYTYRIILYRIVSYCIVSIKCD